MWDHFHYNLLLSTEFDSDVGFVLRCKKIFCGHYILRTALNFTVSKFLFLDIYNTFLKNVKTLRTIKKCFFTTHHGFVGKMTILWPWSYFYCPAPKGIIM